MNSDVDFEDSPKLMKLTSFADNVYPYIGFVLVSPTLSGMLMCLRDVNPSSSRFPFTSVRCGNRYGGNPELVKEWVDLETKLSFLRRALAQEPAPSPSLKMRDFPRPSTFGYQRLHRSPWAANMCLENSRDAFFPLIATVSFFIFYLNFPARHGPLLYWKYVPLHTSSTPSSSKRPPSPAISQALPKRLRPNDLQGEGMSQQATLEEETSPEGASMELRIAYEEWKRNEKERSIGYDDGPYWQFLLAHAGVPVVGISEVADSELACFSDDYPRAGYIVHRRTISKRMFSDIIQTPSIPVWIEWGPSPQRNDYDGLFTSLFPTQIPIDKGKGRALESAWDDWGDMELQNNDEIGDQLPPPPPRKKKHGQYEGETRDEFFTRRAIRRKQRIAAESSKQRQSRMQRATNAELQVCPSSNRSGTTVFIWIEVEGEPERERELII